MSNVTCTSLTINAQRMYDYVQFNTFHDLYSTNDNVAYIDTSDVMAENIAGMPYFDKDAKCISFSTPSWYKTDLDVIHFHLTERPDGIDQNILKLIADRMFNNAITLNPSTNIILTGDFGTLERIITSSKYFSKK